MGRRAREIAALASLAVTWIATRRHVLGADLGLYDETSYLRSGLRLVHLGQWSASLESSPLYTLWYALVALAVPDPVGAYYVQWLAADLVLAAATYAVARTRLTPVPAALATSFFLVLDVVAGGWPRIYHLALAVVLGAAALEHRTRRRAIGAVGLGVAALVRPEYLLALLALAVAWGTERLAPRTRRLVLGAVVLGAVVLPFVTPIGSARLWLAFEQHFAVRAVAEHAARSNDAWTESARITAATFGEARSLGAALVANPVAFLRHLGLNLVLVPSTLVGAVTQTTLLRDVAPALALGALLLHARRTEIPPLPRLLLFACVAALPSLVVQPKATYLLPCVACIVLAAAARLGDLHVASLGLLPVLALLLGPARKPAQDVRGFVFALQHVWEAQPPGTRWKMLEGDGGYCTYLDVARCETVMHTEKPASETFAAFVARSRFDAIVLSSLFAHQADYVNDRTLTDFGRSPEALGYRLVLEHGKRAVYLRVP